MFKHAPDMQPLGPTIAEHARGNLRKPISESGTRAHGNDLKEFVNMIRQISNRNHHPSAWPGGMCEAA